MLLESVAHFTTKAVCFMTNAASVTRQLIPKSVVSHLFGGIDIRVSHIHILSGHIYTNNGIITD